MNKERVRYLLQQFMDGVLTGEERGELSGILRAEPSAVRDVIAEMMEQQTVSSSFENEKVRWQDMLEKILAMDKPGPKGRARLSGVVRCLGVRWAAAAVLILIAGGTWFWLNRQPSAEQGRAAPQHAEIPPGGNKAVLTLEDGSRMVLDDARQGELFSRGSTVVNKTDEGEVGYRPVGGSEQQAPGRKQAVAYHTLTTPRGGQYRIVLPDGTRVWLNAASSLKYPTAFTGKERTVELNGEGYFEVVEDEHVPFRVNIAGEAAVEVLGTRFNITAYQEEESIQTTLLEGSIAFSIETLATDNQKLLKPGQQARISTEGREISVWEVDTEAAVAWKNGYFMFSGESIQSIMRQVARWYDVEIEYRGDITRERFGGTISRFGNVSEVLDMLELTGLVHFKIEIPPDAGQERRILVMP